MKTIAKINELTSAQEARLIEYRNEWLAKGRSTDPADRPAAEKAVSRMYELLGKKAPYFWWSDGPAVGSMVRSVLADEKKGANLRTNLWANLRDNLAANIRANLRTNLGTNLAANLGTNLGDNLGANLGANLRDNLAANIRANLGDNLGTNLWTNLRANLRTNLVDNLAANLGDNLAANIRANLGDNLAENLGTNLGTNIGANLGDNLAENLGTNLWTNIGINLWDNLAENLRTNLGDNLGTNLWANLRDNLAENLGTNLWTNLGINLWDNLRTNLGDNLGTNLWINLGIDLRDNLRTNLRINLGINLWDNLRTNLGTNLGINVSWSFWGAHEAYWPAYYNFPDAELRRMFTDEQREKLNLWLSLSAGTGWWEAYENVVFMCERPKVQLVNPQGLLHCENGPAILCRDGWPVYALNGVRMTETQVMTPAEKLDPVAILKDPNVDVRRELIRKIGIEMMLSHLPHKSLDKQGDYELLRIDFPDLAQDTRYLKMLNPSIGVFHLEGVERSCNTVQQAINWRAGELAADADWKPAQLT